MANLPVIVVEDDPFTRLIPLVLDPKASEERRRAFADFMSTDEPDFSGWCARVRAGSPGLYPAEVRMVTTEAEMRASLKDCVALVVESFRVGPDDLAAAPGLKVVQKFGTGLRNIDTAACTGRGIKLLTLRRRANISCASTTPLPSQSLHESGHPLLSVSVITPNALLGTTARTWPFGFHSNFASAPPPASI